MSATYTCNVCHGKAEGADSAFTKTPVEKTVEGPYTRAKVLVTISPKGLVDLHVCPDCAGKAAIRALHSIADMMPREAKPDVE